MTKVAVQKLSIRQHLKLEKLVETFVKSDSVKIITAFSCLGARCGETSSAILGSPTKRSLLIIRLITEWEG